jgi:hypothetical protein
LRAFPFDCEKRGTRFDPLLPPNRHQAHAPLPPSFDTRPALVSSPSTFTTGTHTPSSPTPRHPPTPVDAFPPAHPFKNNNNPLLSSSPPLAKASFSTWPVNPTFPTSSRSPLSSSPSSSPSSRTPPAPRVVTTPVEPTSDTPTSSRLDETPAGSTSLPLSSPLPSRGGQSLSASDRMEERARTEVPSPSRLLPPSLPRLPPLPRPPLRRLRSLLRTLPPPSPLPRLLTLPSPPLPSPRHPPPRTLLPRPPPPLSSRPSM